MCASIECYNGERDFRATGDDELCDRNIEFRYLFTIDKQAATASQRGST